MNISHRNVEFQTHRSSRANPISHPRISSSDFRTHISPPTPSSCPHDPVITARSAPLLALHKIIGLSYAVRGAVPLKCTCDIRCRLCVIRPWKDCRPCECFEWVSDCRRRQVCEGSCCDLARCSWRPHKQSVERIVEEGDMSCLCSAV